jgi:hypothetical protein
MSKAFIAGILLGITLLIVAGVSGSWIQQKDVNPLQQEELKLYEAELTDSTPVQRGEITEQARIYSKYYSHYGVATNHKKLSDLVDKVKGKMKVVDTIIGIGLSGTVGPAPSPETPEQYFGKLSRTSDAVVRGKVVNKIYNLSEDETFVFTNYKIVILEVIKNNQAVPLNNDEKMTVVRPGGKISMDGVVVRFIDEAFLPLPIQGEVLLFLKYIPETGSYQTRESTGTFHLEGKSTMQLTEETYPSGVLDGVLEGKKSLLQTVRNISK